MSSNRLMYDACAYKKKLDESTGPFNYTMYPGAYDNCAKCRIELGLVGGNVTNLLPTGNMVDIESDLHGTTRPLSDCPDRKFHPQCRNCRNCAMGLPCGCPHCKRMIGVPLRGCQMFQAKPPMPRIMPYQMKSACPPRSKGWSFWPF